MNDPLDFRAVDAVRHAVARRVASAVRHDVVGRLHPLVLLADVLERQLSAAAPDVVGLRRNAGLLQSHLKKEAQLIVRLASWSFPREGTVVGLGQGVAECLSLLAPEFGIRGFRFDNRIGDAETTVAEGPLRMVLTASLLAAADDIGSPADFVLLAPPSMQDVSLSIAWQAQSRTVHGAAGKYAPLSWSEVELLAAAERVVVTRRDDGVVLHFALRRDERT